MEITTYSNFRQNLKGFMDSVLKNRAPLFITRTKGEDVVMLSKEDYESMEETLYLLNSPRNAERLAEGIREYEEGKGIKRELVD